MAESSAPIAQPSWDREQNLVNEYLRRAVDEFDSNRLAVKLMRRLSLELPGCFLTAAMELLVPAGESNALRHLTALVLRQEGSLEVLTNPQQCSRDNAITLFKRFLQIDPSFDVRMAQRLPDRRGANWSEALDVAHTTRALDILDNTSHGRRLLPVVGHLVDHSSSRISAKATLFMGRRVQNPAWTAKQLMQPDQRVRANAVEALWGVDSPAALNILEECRMDGNHRVLGNSLLGLHLLGRREIERRVLEMADAGKYETRSTAAWLLGRIDSQECVDSLTCLLKDDHPQVRSRALRSLLEVHRAKAQLPETVAAQAASPDPTEKAIEPAATLEQNPESIIQLRLDGTRFNVR